MITAITICNIVIAIVSFLSIAWFHVTKHIDAVARQPGRRPDNSVDRLYGDCVDVHGAPSRVYALGTSEDIDRLCRHDSAWINALIKCELGTAARDLAADVYETADGYWNLAHIHNADFRGPDLRVRISKGQSLVKVGAREFRFVVSPMPLDLENRPDRTPAGDKRSEGGNAGNDKRQNFKDGHA